MNNFDLPALEQTIERYPWFSLAHLELFRKMCELGEEQKNAYLKKASAYLYSRERLYEVAQEARRKGTEEYDNSDDMIEISSDITEQEEESEEITFEIETEPLTFKESTKMILVGGDYFDRVDFEQLKLDAENPLDKFIVEKPTLLRSNPAIQPKEAVSYEESVPEEYFEDSIFYTETLAKIYNEQGFYKRALEVYSKLILVYPEKSSYFATLVQEIKSKHN